MTELIGEVDTHNFILSDFSTVFSIVDSPQRQNKFSRDIDNIMNSQINFICI